MPWYPSHPLTQIRSAVTAVLFTIGAVSGAALMLPVHAGDLEVTVIGLEKIDGQIGCALFTSEEGFPGEPEKATRQWHAVDAQTVTCRFPDVDAGIYAIAVSQDFNDNQITDTNLFGVPLEPWGVSNNIRPFMRAPTFEEAQLDVGPDGTQVQIEIAE